MLGVVYPLQAKVLDMGLKSSPTKAFNSQCLGVESARTMGLRQNSDMGIVTSHC